MSTAVALFLALCLGCLAHRERRHRRERRLQAAAAEMERASLARELHDGLIQSLVAAEMRVHAARQHAGGDRPRLDSELAHVEDILHREILNVRDLMQRIKPVRVAPQDLQNVLGEEVDKFGHDTGLSARFHGEAGPVSLSPDTCSQIVRIVREALCNARKHGGAHAVDVRLVRESDLWSLIIEDDGRGLRGSRPAAVQAPAPTVIRECVQAVGGRLNIRPGSTGGLRLEISIPDGGRDATRPGGRRGSFGAQVPLFSRRP